MTKLPCNKCNGSGYVEYNSGIWKIITICYACSGRGWFFSQKTNNQIIYVVV